jgi:hypothetical protein
MPQSASVSHARSASGGINGCGAFFFSIAETRFGPLRSSTFACGEMDAAGTLCCAAVAAQETDHKSARNGHRVPLSHAFR